jgi:hypothetical protein
VAPLGPPRVFPVPDPAGLPAQPVISSALAAQTGQPVSLWDTLGTVFL